MARLANDFCRAQDNVQTIVSRPFSAADMRQSAALFNRQLEQAGGSLVATWSLWAHDLGGGGNTLGGSTQAIFPDMSLLQTAQLSGNRAAFPATESPAAVAPNPAAPVQVTQSQFDELVMRLRAGAAGPNPIGDLTAQIEEMMRRNALG